MTLQERLTNILSLNLEKNYTAISYAIMVDGEIWAADALGTDGTKEEKPATTDHTFNVCSISKIFCTVAVMQLVEQGKVELDAPVITYLPKFTMQDERYKDITVRHLLNHSSGLPGTQWKHFSATHVGSAGNEEYYQEVYDVMAKSYLKAAPGTYSVYCNDGFTLAEMVVAAVSGIPFGEYCKKYITEPIGAHSTRTSTTVNPDYPLIHEKKKVPEYFYLQGCGGFTTNMIDLCKFGSLFLKENDVISEESKAEMAKHQGVTFLEDDTATTGYGLGWDNVAVDEPEFDFGEHVLLKGGNSYQFASKLYVIPKFNAVLAISETNDCGIDGADAILNLFAVALLEEKGVSVFRKDTVVPKELAEKFGGTYIQPSRIMNTHFFGTRLTVTNDAMDKTHSAVFKDLKFDGEAFVGQDGEKYILREHAGDTYLLGSYHGRMCPLAMKAVPHPELNEVWKKRLGRKYIAVSMTEQDMVCHEEMNGFTTAELPGVPGILVCSFSTIPAGNTFGPFESCVVPVDDQTARGFIQTPYHGSRDLTNPYFFSKDGVEYCYTASYLYKDETAVPKYAGETFASANYGGEENSVYRLEEGLKELPEVPEGRRLMVLNKDMGVIYDSQVNEPSEFKEVEEGYISFI